MPEENQQDQIAELQLKLEQNDAQLMEVIAKGKELFVELQAVKEENQVLKEEKQALQEKLAAMQQKAEKYENPTFEYGGETYELLARKVVIPGHGAVTSTDIQAAEELQEFLVRSNSGIIKKRV
jgi:chromosome segregation ATPase